MADVITVPVSFGEVLDKITILEIKSERIADPAKLKNVRLELTELSRTWDEAVPDQSAAQDFGPRFIELARAVYVTNDQRAALKKDINLALGSRFVEEKSYQDYTAKKPG